MGETEKLDISEEDEEVELGPFLSYLESDKGHEIASRCLGIIEDLKKAGIEKTTSQAIFEKWIQAGIIFLVVISASVLTYFGKFDSSLGVLLGTLVGYLFGKK